MKKRIIFLLLISFSFNIFSKTINDGQIIPSDSPIYQTFQTLQNENKHFCFTQNTPLSVGELKFYLEQFNYELLTDNSKNLYDSLHEFLYENEDITTITDFKLALHPRLNPEIYYKSNEELPWSFNYFYIDNFLSMPLDFGYGNNIALGGNFFLGKSQIAAARNDNYFNMPIDFKNPSDVHFVEFYFPFFAYASFGKYYSNWGYNFHIAKQGKTIGKTFTGSIIYNSTFETDAYAELDIYSSAVKYTMDVVQVSSNRMDNIQIENTERYLYIHQFDIRFFKNLKLSVMEGSLIASPFSIRFLNPLPFMHQFGGWTNYITEANKEIYRETNFCADFAYMLEYIPIKNLRLYGIYNQIEMQLPWERNHWWGKYYPNSIGLQFGAEFSINLKDSSSLLIGLEGFYNSPYMYIKQTPSASLYRVRQDMQSKKYVYSWIGSPYGPDAAGGIITLDYNSNNKWKIGLDYSLIAKGENNFNLFNNKIKASDGNEYYDYYPSVEFKLRKEDDNGNALVKDEKTAEQLFELAKNMKISGNVQISNQIKIRAAYIINNLFEINGRFIYNYVVNNTNIKNNNESGVEVNLSFTYKIF